MIISTLNHRALISTGLPMRGVTTQSPTFASIQVSALCRAIPDSSTGTVPLHCALMQTAAMRAIQADNTVLKATVTYPPTMAGSAVALARLVAQGRGMSDLVEQEVPASITLASATVTKDNVAQYLPLGFES